MIKSLVLFVSIILCAGFANAKDAEVGETLDESVLGAILLGQPHAGGRLMTPVDSQANDDQMKAQAYCYAWTTCRNGRRISCWSRGDYCRWAYRAGSYVYCSATNGGRTRWVRYTCY